METCPKCQSKNIMGIEYFYSEPEDYDGISEYDCRDCGYREGRWTHKELKEGFIEPKYGQGGQAVKYIRRRNK